MMSAAADKEMLTSALHVHRSAGERSHMADDARELQRPERGVNALAIT
jgi:hypothetical protein